MKKIVVIALLMNPFYPSLAQNTLVSLCELPNELEEISGMAYDHTEELLWAINDSGNDAVVYGITPDGCNVTSKLFLTNASNVDWEAITLNHKGQLFVADIGNNNYKRKSLKIYWLEAPFSLGKSNVKPLATKVKFPEAVSKKGKITYDFEAMVYIDGYFYFFSKTHKTDRYNGVTNVFKSAAVPGTVHASKIGQIRLCDNAHNCKITDANYNYNTKTLALLSHKNIWLISDFINQLNNKSVTSSRIKLDQGSQKEGITFKADNTLFVSEEKTDGPNLLYTIGW
ncbi:MAG: hypothetical protein ABJM06_03100 [Gilvibacter sp.]